MRSPVLALVALVLAASCGPSPSGWGTPVRPETPQPSRPVAEFPAVSRVELALGDDPPELAPLLPSGAVVVDEWTVESEPAPGDPVYDPGDDPFEALFDDAAAERGVTLRRSASLRCAAQELARFYVRHEAMATQRLTTFILAACGASAIDVHRAASSGHIDDSVPLARVATLAADSMRETLLTALDAEDMLMHGLGVARENGALALVVVSARPTVQLQPWGPPNELDEVRLHGRIAAPADALVAFVNQGAYGVTTCRAEPTVRLPNFDLRCPVAPGDQTAFVNLELLTFGRVLARRAGVIMLRRDGARPVFSAPDAVEGEATGGAALLARLNEVRAQAGLAPLAAAERQSAVHTRAAPFAAAAVLRDQEDAQEVLSLGMMAGWQVEGGTIRGAHHLTRVTAGTRSPARWVAAAIEQPVGRMLLLRPDARQAAIGVVAVEEPPALAAVVSTYSFFESADHSADADRLFARIARERTARGLPPPRRMDRLDALLAQAARVSQGAQPAAAFQQGLDQESRRRRQRLAGLRLEVIDLDHARLPEVLFEQRELTLGLVVAHTRAQGAAWGQYVVFFVFPR